MDVILLGVSLVLLVVSVRAWLRMRGERVADDGRVFVLFCALVVLRNVVRVWGALGDLGEGTEALLAQFFTGSAAGAFFALMVNGGMRRLFFVKDRARVWWGS